MTQMTEMHVVEASTMHPDIQDIFEAGVSAPTRVGPPSEDTKDTVVMTLQALTDMVETNGPSALVVKYIRVNRGNDDDVAIISFDAYQALTGAESTRN